MIYCYLKEEERLEGVFYRNEFIDTYIKKKDLNVFQKVAVDNRTNFVYFMNNHYQYCCITNIYLRSKEVKKYYLMGEFE